MPPTAIFTWDARACYHIATASIHFGAPNGASAAIEFAAPSAGSGSDPSWVAGQKMDQGTCIPGTTSKSPAKDTFTQVASYNETALTPSGGLGDTFLYGATERQTANGSASENIELSQVAAVNVPASAGCAASTAIYRSQGDKLIALNYQSGGSTLSPPIILTWVTSSTPYTDRAGNVYAGTCVVGSDSPPCWSSTTITATVGTFEGATNSKSFP